MTQLSVNVNKLATLRNSRGKNNPDVQRLSRRILDWGAHGITVHPRPDGRHIRIEDVRALNHLVRDYRGPHSHVEFNVEGYPSPDFLELIKEIRPDQVTLVPDPPEALTSNAGWELTAQEQLLHEVVRELRRYETRVSLFIDPFQFTQAQCDALLRIQPDRIELYTERFADHFDQPDRDSVTTVYEDAARFAHDHGVGVNAGHDLNQKNLGFLVSKIPWLKEVSIGHALICEALEQGLQTTIHNYLNILGHARHGT
ncbi:MAG: pyridoxine 5'-phosphate synthase [Bdellovibrionales bacterium]